MKSRRPVNSDVMWHRYSIHGLAAAQYLSYLLVGASHVFMFGAMARAVGNPLVGLGAVLVPLVLGGYASALSFIMPRVAAVMALTCSVPYIILGIPGLFRGVIQANPFIVITSAAVMSISLVAFFWSEGSVWRRLTTTFGKIAILVISMLPALFATWGFGSFLWRFLSSYLHWATYQRHWTGAAGACFVTCLVRRRLCEFAPPGL